MIQKNSELTIRKARLSDLDSLEAVYAYAREFMARTGNPTQWVNGYPSREDLLEDFRKDSLYVCENSEGHIVAAFCFMAGPDPTYRLIQDGQWLNEQPYHVIHRLASDGSHKGIAQICFDWALHEDKNIRVDTHRDNLIMQHLLRKCGFVPCGIIYTHDGTPRIAFQSHQEQP